MNIEDLTIKQARELAAMFGGNSSVSSPKPSYPTDHLIGEYVIVRCRDAGVHAGILISAAERGCFLKNARRLWYWKPAKGAFLSGAAVHGLHSSSKVGTPIDIALTENCEVIKVSKEAENSIKGATDYEPN